MDEKYAGLMEEVLDRAFEKGQEVKLYLANGVQMKGKVEGFDPETIALNCGGRVKFICRQRLSTVEVLE